MNFVAAEIAVALLLPISEGDVQGQGKVRKLRCLCAPDSRGVSLWPYQLLVARAFAIAKAVLAKEAGQGGHEVFFF